MKRTAYPLTLLLTLTLAACGGDTSDTSLTASSSTTSTAATTSSLYNLYVSTAGSDSNTGTEAEPFKTILKASEVAKPGTTVHVAPGTYPGGFRTKSSGTFGAPIRYVSTVKWGAKIVPPEDSDVVEAWTNVGDHVDIVRFEVDGTNIQGGKPWLAGIVIMASSNTVAGNRVHHIAQKSEDCSNQGGAGIIADNYYGGHHIDVRQNVVHDIGISGCNFIHGIYMTTSGYVRTNLVYNIGAWGIHLWHDASDIDIVNNTVAHSDFGIVVGGGDFYKSTTRMVDNVFVSNNIVAFNKVGIIEDGEVGDSNTYTNNLVYGNSEYDLALRSYNPDSGTLIADPLFANPEVANYRLKSASPAIGYGSAERARPIDLVGNPRPIGEKIDNGAYEYIYADAR